MRRAISFLVVAFFLWLPVSSMQSLAQEERTVLVPGNPPLQQNTVHALTDFLEWVMDARMSGAQREFFQKELVETWRADHEIYVLWLKLKLDGDRSGPDRREQIRARMRPVMLKTFREGTGMAQLVQALAASGGKPGAGAAAGDRAAPEALRPYSGSFSASVQGGTLALVLEQREAKVAGRLDGLGGTVFQLQGDVQPDGRVLGVARGQSGGLFFFGQRQGDQLQMVFAEPDANLRPNMATARHIPFVAQGAGRE
jgi:hypothetical protein